MVEMKSALLGAAVAIALASGCTDDGGVFLDLHATDHFESEKLEIRLASADDANIALDVKQRLEPKSLTNSPVDYYRQRATGGTVMPKSFDGYKVKIEPDDSVADDEQFVPIVLVYGPSGDITAIGTVEDANGELFKMPVRSDQPAYIEMNVHPVTGVEHICANENNLLSGIVWTSTSGKQQRLLLPESGNDASTRKLDIDCDDVAADAGAGADCDDLASDTHPGAKETCDGVDTACDNDGYAEQPCTLTNEQTCVDYMSATTSSTNQGVGLCREVGGEVHSLGTRGCVLPPNCTTSTPGHSGTCSITMEESSSANELDSCTDAIGDLAICAGACTVEVGTVDGDIEVSVSDAVNGNYRSTTVAMQGTIFIKVKDRVHTHPRPIDTHLGRVFFVLDSADATSTQVVGVDFRLSSDAPMASCARPHNGDADMACARL
jgi:hypothetical protein